MGHDLTQESGQEVSKSRGSDRVESGRIRQEVFESHGSGLVGSGGFQNLAGRVGSVHEYFSSLGSGRVGSGQEVTKSARVGSQRSWPARNGSLAGRVTEVVTREFFSADPRIGPAHPARGSRHFIKHFFLPRFLLLPKGFSRASTRATTEYVFFWYRNQTLKTPPKGIPGAWYVFACPHPSIPTTGQVTLECGLQ